MAADAETHVAMLLSVEDMATKVITTAQRQVEAATDAVTGALEKSITTAEKASFAIGGKLKGAAISAAVNVQSLAKSLLDVTSGTIGKGLKFSLLGPFELLFKLVRPIIKALVDTFMPAMETFGAIVKTSLAPLGFLFETMAQQLAPLVVKWITPMVKLLEIAAIHFGSFLADLLDTGKAASPLAGLFTRLMPVIEQVFKILPEIAAALLDVGKTLLPVILDAFMELAPVVGDVVKLLGKEMVGIVKELAGVFKETGPLLVRTFADLLKALIPILPPLAKLAGIIVRDILAPATIAALTGIAKFIADPLIPFIEKWLPKLVELMKWLGETITEFFGPTFAKSMSDFKVLWIDPILEFLTMGNVSGVAKAFTAPLETLKKGINALVVDPLNNLLTAEIPIVGKLGEVLGIDPIPFLAKGAAMVDTPAVVGEAGPEMVLPLTPEHIERVLTPILPDVEMPGMDEAVEMLGKIHKVLSGTLKVRSVDAQPGGGFRDHNDLGAAVGMAGLGGV